MTLEAALKYKDAQAWCNEHPLWRFFFGISHADSKALEITPYVQDRWDDHHYRAGYIRGFVGADLSVGSCTDAHLFGLNEGQEDRRLIKEHLNTQALIEELLNNE